MSILLGEKFVHSGVSSSRSLALFLTDLPFSGCIIQNMTEHASSCLVIAVAGCWLPSSNVGVIVILTTVQKCLLIDFPTYQDSHSERWDIF